MTSTELTTLITRLWNKITSLVSNKQDALVSGTNIKTINNTSILGSGNIDIQGGGGTQVQSDWTEADTDNPAYIKNKPTIPDGAFLVTFTSTTNNDFTTYSADKTVAQILAAYQAGRQVIATNNNEEYGIYQLASVTDTVALFEETLASGNQMCSFEITGNGVTFTVSELQSELVSGTNIKTINSGSILGSGNLALATSADLSNYCPIIEDGRSSSVAAITGTAPFSSLVDGQRIVLHFKYRNEASPTLELTLSGGTTTSAYPLYQNYNNGVNALTVQAMPAGSYGEFVYDATNSRWVLIGKDFNTTYSNTTQADINNAAQGSRLIEPKLLVDNFVKLRKYVDNSADASVQLAVTTYNDLGTLSTWKTITLPATYDRADEFVFRFTCNDASLTPTLPTGVVMADNFEWSEMAVGVVFQVSICDGIAAYLCLTPQNP